MNKNLLFLLFLTTFFSLPTHPWFENSLTSYIRNLWLKRQEKKAAMGYLQQNIKRESSPQSNTQTTEDPKEIFQQALYRKIIDANNRWGLVEDFYEYNRTKKIRMCLPDHKKIQKQMADESNQFYDLIEKYQYWLETSTIFDLSDQETTNKMKAVNKINDFKITANFYEFKNIRNSVNFTKILQPYNFDKKLNKFLTYLVHYITYEISHYYMSFYQLNQFE